MAKKTSADFDADIQKFIAGSGGDLPAPTPALLKEMNVRLRRLQTRYSLATNPTEKAIVKAEFDALAKAEHDAKVAQKKLKAVQAKSATFVTGTNLSALVDLVIESGGPVTPRRVAAVDAPHIKRCVMAGLLEETGGSMRLTQEGRARVADELVKRIDRETRYPPRADSYTSVPDPEKRAQFLERDRAAHKAAVDKLERVLATLTR